MSELISLTLTQMREGLLKGSFSAGELVDAHLSRIETTNEKLNSFISISSNHAKEQAKTADEVLAKDKDASPFFTGIPVGIKDMLVTQGIETTCASKILKGFIPPYQCTAVKKLVADGAIIVGKTNLDEFAMGASNENSSFGPVKNPWDTSRVSGGSSGGSAVAVAAGQSPVSLGTDTGGSIRQPASFNGIIGLKPTYGRVSRYGAVAFASSLDQIGAFGRTVEDVARVLQTISGHDAKDSTSMNVEVDDFLANLKVAANTGLGKLKEGKALRVGVPKQYFTDGMNKEVEQSVKAAIAKLGELGAEIVEIDLPHTEYAIPTYYIINPAEASSNLARYDGVRYGNRAKAQTLSQMYSNTRSQGFGNEVKRRILVGTFVLSTGYYDAYYKKAQQVRTLIIEDFQKAFTDKCDIIAAPVAPTTAFKLGENTADPLQMYLQDIFTCTVNLAGLPGLSIPCGLDSSGLPIGLQLIGNAFGEADILSAADIYLKNSSFDTSKQTREFN